MHVEHSLDNVSSQEKRGERERGRARGEKEEGRKGRKPRQGEGGETQEKSRKRKGAPEPTGKKREKTGTQEEQSSKYPSGISISFLLKHVLQ